MDSMILPSDTLLLSEQLLQAKNQLALVLCHAGEGIYGLDKDGITRFANLAASKMVGISITKLEGKLNHASVHHHRPDGSHYPKQECPIYATLKDGIKRQGDDEYFCRADGSFFPIEYCASPIIEQGEITGVVVTFKDITERKQRDQQLLDYQNKLEQMVDDRTHKLEQANEQLKKMTLLDGLTKIANRRAFDESFHREIRRSATQQQSFTLMIADIDYFKGFNDRFGHCKGDTCLKEVAQLMDRSFKRAGTLVARYGGEEFAIILPDTNQEQSQILAQQLLENIEKLAIPHPSSQCSDVVTLSIGVLSLVPSINKCIHVEDSHALLDLADKALYQAKQDGRNRYRLHSEVTNT